MIVAVNVLPERRTEIAPDTVSVSVVIPCLNEEDSIGQCVVGGTPGARRARGSDGEVLVVDNGSEDGSASSRRSPERGSWRNRGAATAAPTSPASPRARGDYIVMIDADLSYDFEEIPRFVRSWTTVRSW